MKNTSSVRKACLSGLATASLLAATIAASAFGATAANAADPADPVQAAVNYLVAQGISPAAAQQRIDGQAARGELATRFETALGSHTGGAYTDSATGELTITVTDDFGAAAASAQGLQTVRVAHSLPKLKSLSEQLASSLSGVGSARWSINPVANSVELSLPGSATLTAAQQAVLDVNASALKVNRTTTTVRTSAGTAAYGGQRYLFDNNQYTCSIGFFGKSNSDPSDIKVIQAGHCTKSVGGAITKDGAAFGTNQASSFKPGSSTDYGLLDINTTNFTGKGAVDKYDGTYLSVKGSTNVAVGDTICKSGQKTKWKCSKVTSASATVTYDGDNVTLKDMIQTNGCTIPGDSGGSNLSGNYAAGVTSGGNFVKNSSGQFACASTQGQADETFVQKVGPALQAYNVSLLTS